MKTPLPPDPVWSRKRWLRMLILVFILQVTLIFALGRRGTPPTRAPGPVPVVAAAPEGVRSWPLSIDPTLLARPNRMGFAGGTWLTIRPPSYDAADLVEAPETLSYSVEDAGRAYLASVGTNVGGYFQLVARPELQPGTPVPVTPAVAMNRPSTLKLEGNLTRRPLVSGLDLPAWRHHELLHPTIVQLTVDGLGRAISAFVTESSGYAAADERALALARAAVFAPAKREGPGRTVNPSEGMLWGRMIFEWQTLPREANTETNPISP